MHSIQPLSWLAALACAAGTTQLGAQQGSQEPTRPMSIEELQQRIAALESQREEDIEDLHFQIESLERELAAAQLAARAGTPRSQSVFNPGITVFGNFLGRMDDRPAFVDDDPGEARVDDQFHLREVELDFRAPIDPWADGVVIATLESEAPGEFEALIEEGYVVLKRLPILEVAPGGLKLKVGRFRTEFGRFNQIHLHDLPQTTYPRALGTFLGPEGFIQDGVSGQFFLPTGSESRTLEATVQVLNGGALPVGEDLAGFDISSLGHLKLFSELGDTSTLDLGLSGWEGDADHRLYGLDATYKWKPLAAGEWRSFLLGGEWFQADLDDPALDSSPSGFYAWSQYQLDRNLYVGLRYDRAEQLDDASQMTQTVGAFATYYTTEFLRFRLGIEHTESDVDELDGSDTLSLELNSVFGSHPVEPYWVNR